MSTLASLLPSEQMGTAQLGCLAPTYVHPSLHMAHLSRLLFRATRVRV